MRLHKFIFFVVILFLSTSCAGLYHQIIPQSRGKMVEIVSVPSNADIYISSDENIEGQRLDSMICSGTPCQVYLEPEHWVTLKKSGYADAQIHPTKQRSPAYFILGPILGGLTPLITKNYLGLSSISSIAIGIVTGLAVTLTDFQNPKTYITDNLQSPVPLQLIDADLAQQGELNRQARDVKEAKERERWNKQNNRKTN